ncbi:MAG: hypothetical protein NT001_01485 [Candidatus Woesearchaeota archaeon]|nr:hypothetical protein [Candidatus Woesearchaeota archaeon]
MILTHISEAMRMFKVSIKTKLFGYKKYDGNADEICRKIVKDCWNPKKRYFMASSGHFSQFYSRDFGMCVEALLKLGYEKEVFQTLEYALSRFNKAGKITTAITPSGKPFDFPYIASDSLPFIVHAIRIAEGNYLMRKYERLFLNEIRRYFNVVFDSRTGMVKSGKSFSSIKDYSRRNSSTYDNCMAAMLKHDLDELNFFNPLHDFDIKANIKKNLWNGKFFYDDLNKLDTVYGDANVFPFWTGIFTDRKMLESCVKEMKRAGLDRPLPLKYTSKRKVKGQKMIWEELIAGDYERDTVWTHLGMCYLDILKRFGKKKELAMHLKQYRKAIERQQNFIEVFGRDGKPFKTLFYQADSGMLWASKYL